MERHARALADGTLEKVGVNAFQVPDTQDVLLRDVAERKIEPCRERIAWMTTYRAQRDVGQLRAALQALDTCARDPCANLLPAIVAATKAGATMGEMAGVLRRAYGHPADPFGQPGDLL
jgi:ethylmalonyl-CoA mutase